MTKACTQSFALNRIFSRNQSVRIHVGTPVMECIGWISRNDDGRHDADVPKSLEDEITNLVDNPIQKKQKHAPNRLP